MIPRSPTGNSKPLKSRYESKVCAVELKTNQKVAASVPMTSSCTVDRSPAPALTYYPLLLLSAGLWGLLAGLSPFAQMCGVAVTLFVLIKIHTLLHYLQRGGIIDTPADIVLWFVAWHGLDAAAFFHHRPAVHDPARDWIFAAIKTGAGIVLCGSVAPSLLTVSHHLAAWTALFGILLCLHFGLMHLVALGWRHRGRPVVPIMNAPALATSLTDFWNRRWNIAFRDYAHFAIFAPLTRHVKPHVAVLAGYVFSGIIHELAISVPAGAGYGLPTLYFSIQGAGIVIERRLRRVLRFSERPFLRWLWTATITVGPVWLLFHSAFLERVIIPLISPLAP